MKTKVEVNIPKSEAGEAISFSKEMEIDDKCINLTFEERTDEVFDAFIDWLTKYVNICV